MKQSTPNNRKPAVTNALFFLCFCAALCCHRPGWAQYIVPAAGTADSFGYRTPLYVTLSTNLLPWATLVPSVGFETGNTKVNIQRGSVMPNLKAECFFARRWSVGIGGMYANFAYADRSRDRWAVSSASLESRYWLRRDRFTGFSTGVFATIGDFNIKGRAADPDTQTLWGRTGRFLQAGISMGYKQRLVAGLSLEANLRGGYRQVSEGKKYRYDNDPDRLSYLQSHFASTGFMLGAEMNVSYIFRIR